MKRTQMRHLHEVVLYRTREAKHGPESLVALAGSLRVPVREQVGAAHERGVMARYWNQPAWPVGTRNAIWRTLWDEGVDLLNVDDLKGCSEFWEGGG
ncbi:hypothetical protein HBI70_131630 [Parastagonospora nodorum]|nr:hypothetical protein HBI70_131630 [Parastagonospora nodorum]KAH5599557.1 hypothetical protein HBI45_150840 [Parastagonospora nodorum]KAH6378116.1 hypothetical protein HBI34_034890 [Parastagonospora nodorum]